LKPSDEVDGLPPDTGHFAAAGEASIAQSDWLSTRMNPAGRGAYSRGVAGSECDPGEVRPPVRCRTDCRTQYPSFDSAADEPPLDRLFELLKFNETKNR